MSSIEISIIMVTYNREQFIVQAIESILNQTKKEFELIIVNNGSKDRTKDICAEYEKQDSRIKVINRENGNIGSARNSGLEIAQGRYISFVDDDDYMEKDMFEYLHAQIQEYEADISICGCYSDFGDCLEVYYVYDEHYILNKVQGIEELLNRKLYNSANPCKLFKRELFNQVRYLEVGKYDDIHTIYKLFAAADKTIVSGVPKYYFRKHQKNNSRFIVDNQLSPEQLEEYLEAFEKRTKYLADKVPATQARAKCAQWSYMISMIDKIEGNRLYSCYDVLDIMKREVKSNLNEFSNSKYLTKRDMELLEKYF